MNFYNSFVLLSLLIYLCLDKQTVKKQFYDNILYYTIIDFNEGDIRIYLPEKVIIHRGRQAMVNITFKGRSNLMSTEIGVNNCFVI